jgi:hypothetical protein
MVTPRRRHLLREINEPRSTAPSPHQAGEARSFGRFQRAVDLQRPGSRQHRTANLALRRRSARTIRRQRGLGAQWHPQGSTAGEAKSRPITLCAKKKLLRARSLSASRST